MCGIIGYLGERSAAPIIMDSLKRLEYRGYDSAGVAIFNEADGQTSVVKSAAKVDTLVERLTEEMPEGRLGIGHTRSGRNTRAGFEFRTRLCLDGEFPRQGRIGRIHGAHVLPGGVRIVCGYHSHIPTSLPKYGATGRPKIFRLNN